MDDVAIKARMGRALQIARERAGITQAALADALGTKQSAVSRLEAGQRWPSARTLAKIMKATRTHVIGSLLAEAEAERKSA